MRIAGIAVVIALLSAALPGHAHGDASRAWAAAKAGLPAETKLVVGADLAALEKTQLFATYYPKLRDRPDVAEILNAVRESCKLNPIDIVQGLVVGMSGDHEDGAAYLALAGVDRAKMSSCLQLVSQAKNQDAKVSLKQDGDTTEIARGKDTVFFGWAGKDVLVVAFHARDKAALVKWMRGKGALARSALGKILARADTSAAIWGASDEKNEVEPGITVQGGHGAIAYAGGKVFIDIRAAMSSAAEASKLATSAGKHLGEAKQGGAPPELAQVLNAVTISADKDQVRLKASITERDLLSAVAVALGGR